jgi:thiaminase
VAQPSGSNAFTSELVRRGREIAAGTPRHDFVLRTADGSLPVGAFLRYLVQNALFLDGYAAALREALETGVAPPVAELLGQLEAWISGSALDRHVTEYQSLAGQDPALRAAAPSNITTAYVGHLRASARSGGPAILCAILPGEQSYAAAGRYYAAFGDLGPGNPYAGWIAQYTAGQVDELVAEIVACIASAPVGARMRQDLLHVYERSAQLDRQFWEMAGRPEES